MKAEESLTSKDERSLLKISSSSMQRRRHRDVNPFPEPNFYGVGSANQWFTSKLQNGSLLRVSEQKSNQPNICTKVPSAFPVVPLELKGIF